MTNWEIKRERKKYWYWRLIYFFLELRINHCRHWGKEKWWHNLIAWTIRNPFKTWWKARKYFKFPEIRVCFTTSKYSFPYASGYWRGKILDVCIKDVTWKDKWDSPRHEYNPVIFISLFSKFSLWIQFTMSYKNEFGEKEDGSMEYWEYILQYVYYKQSLKTYSGWIRNSSLYKKVIEYGEDESEDKTEPYKFIIPCVAMSLNKRGIKELKKELNK